MRLLPRPADELLRTGWIQVATGPEGGEPLLVTRIGIGGDVMVAVARSFADAPDAALASLHRARTMAALERLRTMESRLAGAAHWIAAAAPAGISAGTGALAVLAAQAPPLSTLAIACATSLAGYLGLRPAVTRWLAGRIARRFLRVAQDR
jgi:hypothetical protein